MYSASYGYPNAAGPAFNGAPQPQNMQPGGPSPNAPQQMMYNPQQFPMGAQGAFPGAPNPAAMMPGGAGPAGMMQNTALPHMAANGQMSFQQPFTSAPYGAGMPSTSAGPQGQFHPNYMMAAGGSMGGFPMNAPGMPHQMNMQRMHPSQQNPAGMGTPTAQRPFSVPQGGTPTPSMPSQPAQSQISTPQNNSGTPQSQTPTQTQPPAAGVSTPQTPTFPATGQAPAVNGTSASAPLSPGSDPRDRERFGVLLEINQELLYECMLLQNTQHELKKEQAAAAGADGTNSPSTEESEEEKQAQQDYTQCLRRLQANLSYMAALYERKGNVQLPPGPAYLRPPPLDLTVKIKGKIPNPNPAEKVDPSADREERDRRIRDLYRRLQALYPGVDPNKEPSFQMPVPRPQGNAPNPAAAAHRAASGQAPNQVNSAASPDHSQRTPQMMTSSAPPAQTQAVAMS